MTDRLRHRRTNRLLRLVGDDWVWMSLPSDWAKDRVEAALEQMDALSGPVPVPTDEWIAAITEHGAEMQETAEHVGIRLLGWERDTLSGVRLVGHVLAPGVSMFDLVDLESTLEAICGLPLTVLVPDSPKRRLLTPWPVVDPRENVDE